MRVRFAIVVTVATLALAVPALALAAPQVTVTGVTPNHGPPAGGNIVTITGSGFTGATTVSFGLVSANFVPPTVDTSITAIVPPGAPGPVHVIVTNGPFSSTPSNADLYRYNPAVTDLNPNHGPAAGGNQVTIIGQGFGGSTTVKFGASTASNVRVFPPTTITADAPPGLAGQTVNVTVTNANGTSATAGTANDYTYDGPVASNVASNLATNAPDTFLTHHPRHHTHKRQVSFAFDSNMDGAQFQCLFAQGWAKCRSPHVFRHLKPGRYRFMAEAIVNGVADPTPASFTFRILR
jgi:IPT/TIG domain